MTTDSSRRELEADEKNDRAQVRSVRRAAAILKAFQPGETFLGVNELGRRLDLLPSTVHRIACSLAAEGLLEHDPETGKYRLGLEVLRLGRLSLAQRGLREQAVGYMESLAQRTGETVNLGALVDGQLLILERVESEHSLRAGAKLGEARAVHCTAGGKALLSLLPEAEVDRIVESRGLTRFTPNTICSAADLKRHLAEVRHQGYAVDDEEGGLGIRCIGAPVFDHRGRAVAALAVAGPAERLPLPRLLELKVDLLGAAEGMSRELGWLPPSGR